LIEAFDLYQSVRKANAWDSLLRHCADI
jgi:hypothetical protein